jgi:hypothetical protein
MPFDPTSFDVKDGRKVALHNSGFGTVFAVAGDRPLPVCDYAGFAPFGFDYRRCPGEQLTIMAFEDLIRKVAKERLEFVKVAGVDAQKSAARPEHSRDGAHRSHHRHHRRHRIHPPLVKSPHAIHTITEPQSS